MGQSSGKTSEHCPAGSEPNQIVLFSGYMGANTTLPRPHLQARSCLQVRLEGRISTSVIDANSPALGTDVVWVVSAST